MGPAAMMANGYRPLVDAVHRRNSSREPVTYAVVLNREIGFIGSLD